ncbi:MAG: hypothetical protein H6708_29780 [Kofleriaceae bacterium]|nr:hypothetical protein [Myxococcales bacterium]MCB9564595.1 hypothetical protein [Kofleriaceae bacterium]
MPRTARADLGELKWATEGYFRTRTVYLTNLAPQPRTVAAPYGPGREIVMPDIRHTSYIDSRLRIMPTLSYAKLASMHFQIDAMDDVLWGDNNGLSSAPLFATDSSNQYFLGGAEKDSVQIKRAWVEFQVPVGLMRVGRMPSHWGLGLLANGGGTGNIDPTTPIGQPPRAFLDNFMADDFGDKHFGSTADRILFITKPMSIYKTITKAGDISSNIVVGYAFDKLSEAPLLAFEPYERQVRPFGQQGFISRGSSDDVNEHVVLAVYNDPDWNRVRYTDELRVGFYGVLRKAKQGSTNPTDLPAPTETTCGTGDFAGTPCVDTGSKVWIADLWWRVRYGPWYTEGEGYKIGGTTFGGVPFPFRNSKKDASINAGVARFGYFDPTDTWDAIFEIGHASGDETLSDEHFTQRAMHPDYNVGLILFEDVLRERSARAYGPNFISNENPNGATGFFSNGGVINANYLYPRGHFRLPLRNFKLTGALLMAWADKLSTDVEFIPEGGDNSTYLGTEVDLALKASFAQRMEFSLETGYLAYGAALKRVLTEADSSFSLQTRLAFVW